MQAARPGKLQSSINVTPLVDVVLVLLIIFMVVAPQMDPGPGLDLPTTEQPPQREDGGRQILIAIERSGKIWIDRDPVAVDGFHETLREAAQERADWKLVIKGDSRLTFGQVKQVMLAADAAGFRDVGLIAERRDATARED